ncbi:MAG TPA: hypothetical protein VMM76_10005 [Pirellulaceae bacterium]|nr:hypothetical protein [Pirellulaceae bacterium]
MKYIMFVALAVATSFCSLASAQDAPNRDSIRVAVQEICPVSGKSLGSMGKPIKAIVGEAKEEVFLCCKGCLRRKINAQHWATMRANIKKAQGICPVMKDELPEDAKSTIVEGQIVYVCCPPCTKKIAANAPAFLASIDELYLTSLKARETQR